MFGRMRSQLPLGCFWSQPFRCPKQKLSAFQRWAMIPRSFFLMHFSFCLVLFATKKKHINSDRLDSHLLFNLEIPIDATTFTSFTGNAPILNNQTHGGVRLVFQPFVPWGPVKSDTRHRCAELENVLKLNLKIFP